MDMKWCIFVNRRCYGEDCSGWVKDSCFIYLLLPADYSGKELQTEFDWSKYESLGRLQDDMSEKSDHQLTFLDEIEKLIVQKNYDYKKM
jgi:hypothetical protein